MNSGVLFIIVAVVVALLLIAVSISIYGVGYRSLNALGTLAGSISPLGYNAISIVLTATGGNVIINNIIVYGTNNAILMNFATGYQACPLSISIYNASGVFTSWGSQVLSPGESITINIQASQSSSQPVTIIVADQASCIIDVKYIQVVYNNGKSTILINPS